MRSDARKRQQSEELCEGCGYPENSFACRIRHINIDTSWAKGDH